MIQNMIGAYGEWAAQATQDPARLSFRLPAFGNAAYFGLGAYGAALSVNCRAEGLNHGDAVGSL